MQSRLHTTTQIDALGANNYVLHLEGAFEGVRPGQFVMLSLPTGWPVQLPRPFSYFDIQESWASFFLKVLGPGTQALVEAGVGAEIKVTGPLGSGFPQPQDIPGNESAVREPVCIAGGVGLAPFLLWCRERQAEGRAPVPMLYGGATAEAVVGHDYFEEAAQSFHLSTDDGSLGFHGNVLDLYRCLARDGLIDGQAPVYCCGPDAMMQAVARDCAERAVPCYVSLETYMACGYGVCNGCSVEVKGEGRFAGKRYVKTCCEGPVFASTELAR
ncbi:MAG: hypothetical protein CSA62_12475 [Planctomycetota bacterium]|nr:MAG: hypothetical protein CSA62_12475 [Planctomycetota bacterium]